MTMTLMSNPKGAVATKIVATDGSGDFNCDGTADDVEIQAAINSLPAGGGCIYMKEGVYNLAATIIINADNISIRGCGRSTQILSPGITAFEVQSGDGLRFEEFLLQGDNTATTYGILIAIDLFSNYSIFDHLWIEQFDIGIYNAVVGGLTNGGIVNCFIYDNVNDGINIPTTRMKISGNDIVDNGRDGIVTGGNYSVIDDNSIQDNGQYGINDTGLTINSYTIVGNNINGNVIGIYGKLDFTIVSANYLNNDTNEVYMTINSIQPTVVGNFITRNIVDLGLRSQIFNNHPYY